MAKFDIAYRNYILPNEGGYANLKNDKGGETYAGIARNYNPTWPGWTFIDFEKKKLKTEPKNNTKWPVIQYLVDQFYCNRWNANRFSKIVSQEVANLLYDFHVHSQSNATRVIQKIVGIPADGAMSPATITAINKSSPAKLHDSLLIARKKFLERLIENNPGQEVHRKGWMYRLAKFPVLFKQQIQDTGPWPLVGIAAIGTALAIWHFNKKTSNVNRLKTAA